MGSQASTVGSGRIKTFVPNTANIDFSANLLAELENSKETDFTRGQVAERYIEQKVSRRLSQLEEETLKKFESKLDSSLLHSSYTNGDSLSSKIVNEKIAKLNEKLAALEERDQLKSEKFAKLQSKDTGKSVREELVSCLLQNKETPLNCYDLMQQFKTLVAEQL